MHTSFSLIILPRTVFRLFSLSVFLISFLSGFTQVSEDPNWVERVLKQCQLEEHDKPVEIIVTDSTMWQYLPYALKKHLNVNYFSGVYLDTLESGVEYLQLTTNPSWNSIFNSTVYELYFKGDKILMLSQSYNNNSRMGSCGHIAVWNQAFFQNNTLEYVKIMESPFFCYYDPIDTNLFTELANYFNPEIRSQLPFALFIQDIERYKKEIQHSGKQKNSLAGFPYPLKEYSLKWIKPVLNGACRPKKDLSLFPLSMMGSYEIIGDRFITIQVNDPTPTGFQYYTTYYLEQEKAQKKEGE